MFDAEKIAKQALHCADEAKKKSKSVKRRTMAALSVFATGLGVFLLLLSVGLLTPVNEPETVYIEDKQVPLGAFRQVAQTENDSFICPACGDEDDEDDGT